MVLIILVGVTAGLKILGLVNSALEEEVLPRRRIKKAVARKESPVRFTWNVAFTAEDNELILELDKHGLSDLITRASILRKKLDAGERVAEAT